MSKNKEITPERRKSRKEVLAECIDSTEDLIRDADFLMGFGNSDFAKRAESLYKESYDKVTMWIIYPAYRKHLDAAQAGRITGMIARLEDTLGIDTDEDRQTIWDEFDPLQYIPEIRKPDLRLGKIAAIMDSLIADNLR
jgi:hypothetical protein